jgi:hypothetical protein
MKPSEMAPIDELVGSEAYSRECGRRGNGVGAEERAVRQGRGSVMSVAFL